MLQHIDAELAVTAENLRVLDVQAEYCQTHKAPNSSAFLKSSGLSTASTGCRTRCRQSHRPARRVPSSLCPIPRYPPRSSDGNPLFPSQPGPQPPAHRWRWVHTVDPELPEAANHDPTGMHVMGQVVHVTAGLLIRRQHGTIRLLIAMPQINIHALLFNEDAYPLGVAVNKADMIQLHRIFKFLDFFR